MHANDSDAKIKNLAKDNQMIDPLDKILKIQNLTDD